jgi:DNA-binding NtrC family response regulator
MQSVLLVEDDARSLTNMETAAKEARGGDRRILTASNRDSAIRFIEEEDVDVVVTDLALHSRSDTDGFDVLRAAKAKDPDVPVIVVSNYLTDRKTREALDLDAFDIIDRAASSSDPQAMLRLEIGKALRSRAASRT